MKKESNKFLLYFVVFVIAIFIVFFVSFKFFSGEEDYETLDYNFFEFVKIDNIWYTEWQKDETVYTVSMRNHPSEVEHVPVEGSLDESFNQPEVYVSFHPQKGNFTVLSLAAGELSLSMFRALGVKPVAACMVADNETCSEQPIASCADEDTPVIQLVNEGSAAVILEGDCIQLQGEGMDLLKSVDRLLYQWYGIMK